MALKLPGIEVSIVNATDIVAPPVYERYPVYIGEGDPYRIVTNQEVVRSMGSVDNLRSVTTINEITSVGDLPGIANYTGTTDYVLSGNTISWAPGGDAPTLGDSFYVTFTETRPASAYVPSLYFDGNLVIANHGEKTRTNGNINDVVVGASLGLNAGSKGVIVAQLNLSGATDPDSPTNLELENAFIAMREEIDKITGYKLFLVPMSSGTLSTTTAASIYWNHAVLVSTPERKQERTVVMSLPKTTTYQVAATTAQTFANERMVVPYAADGETQVVGFTTIYDMRFGAATLAGLLCSGAIGQTFSEEVLPNMLISDNLNPAQNTYLVQRGVSPMSLSGTVVRVIMPITTDTTSALTEDLGVQDVSDYVKKYWREGLWDLYKNKKINANMISQVEASSRNILEYLQGQTIVDEWQNVSASQSTVEPRQINVTGQIKPAFSLQWMDITFTFVLSFT